MIDRPKAFVIGGLVSRHDPLDPTTAIKQGLSGAFDVVEVRPGSAMTTRGVLRARRPGIDAVLFDFTDPIAARSLMDLSRSVPDVILLGASKPRYDSRPLRAWQEQAVMTPHDWPLAALLALDANVGGRSIRAAYPVLATGGTVLEAKAAQAAQQFLCFGTPDALYGALLGWRGFVDRPENCALTLAVSTPGEAALLGEYSEALSMAGEAEVKVAASRMQVIRLCNGADAVVDINPVAWPGKTVPLLAAGLAGIPAQRIDMRLDQVPGEVFDFFGQVAGGVAKPAAGLGIAAASGFSAFDEALTDALAVSLARARQVEGAL